MTAVLTSGTRYLAGPARRRRSASSTCSSPEWSSAAGASPGRSCGPICYGDGKIYWAEQFAEAHGIDLARSYFYTDSVTDLPVLERVGHPRVVNPDPRLRRVAQRRGWPVVWPRVDAQHAEAVALETGTG